jgi:hypothetical protein
MGHPLLIASHSKIEPDYFQLAAALYYSRGMGQQDAYRRAKVHR